MKTMIKISTAAMIAAALAAPASAATTIAMQDFDAIGPAFPSNPSPNGDSFSSGTVDAPLTNPGASYDGVSPIANGGMTFQTLWTDTRGNEGPVAPSTGGDSGDFIGANSFSGSNAPGVDPSGDPVGFTQGQYNFQFNDGDGLLELTFDPVDISGFTGVQFSFAYWIADTGYETGDLFEVTLDDGTNTETLLSFDDTGLEANTSADNGTANWNTVTFNLSGSALTGSSITAVFAVDTNASSENIFVDDIVFSGTAASNPIPMPAGVWLGLAGFAGMAARQVRRRTA